MYVTLRTGRVVLGRISIRTHLNWALLFDIRGNTMTPRCWMPYASHRRRRMGHPAKDIIVVTPEEVRKYRDVVGSIIYPALREGKVLYERAA